MLIFIDQYIKYMEKYIVEILEIAHPEIRHEEELNALTLSWILSRWISSAVMVAFFMNPSGFCYSVSVSILLPLSQRRSL